MEQRDAVLGRPPAIDQFHPDRAVAAVFAPPILQADNNNDDDKIRHRGADHLWRGLVTVSPPPDSLGVDPVTSHLGRPIMADGFMITGVNGDGLYAVAELPAMYAAPPAPGAYAMLGVDLAGPDRTPP